ncbi:hypothetical protein [Sporocytophaga myxococcoides]|uniref:hypothetical protein n=1 Tax=Sporocytophaga myxococcoides TaxID=153721 RepID=UPI000402BCE9|nr:hypothetical protein [Sporocytophaga myxococcoides]
MSSALETIAKEKLSEIHFTKDDVLSDPAKKRLRNIYLKKAELLGNAYKGKVKMFFKTLEGNVLCVETTIWEANEEYITLKGGINIPTKSILEIEF